MLTLSSGMSKYYEKDVPVGIRQMQLIWPNKVEITSIFCSVKYESIFNTLS